ncbi:MAG TPA: L-ribulose-5-phosphate 4-epimerase [Clostridiales bacterium]|nr:L-ribulose-5-phosphate 4-epimerase [Clostridiales bacterium]
MDISERQYKIGLYEKALPKDLSWAEKLAAARTAGYDFLEISIDETDEKLARLDWLPSERAEMNRLMADSGLPLRSMCLSAHRRFPIGSPDETIRNQGMTIMAKALQLADDLGIRIIQLAGYDVYYEESTDLSRKQFSENLRRAARMAAGAGILLGFETMETPFMNTVAKAMSFVRMVDSPYLHVYPDIGNITNAALDSGEDVLEDLESGRGRLIALHLKETRPGHFREIPLGEGHVDFDAAIAKAVQLGVGRYVVECWHTGSENWLEEVTQTCRLMRGKLDLSFSINDQMP